MCATGAVKQGILMNTTGKAVNASDAEKQININRTKPISGSAVNAGIAAK